MKICTNRSVTNYAASSIPGASVTPTYGDHPNDGVPFEIDTEIREFVRDILPELADREWLTTRMCW